MLGPTSDNVKGDLIGGSDNLKLIVDNDKVQDHIIKSNGKHEKSQGNKLRRKRFLTEDSYGKPAVKRNEYLDNDGKSILILRCTL